MPTNSSVRMIGRFNKTSTLKCAPSSLQDSPEGLCFFLIKYSNYAQLSWFALILYPDLLFTKPDTILGSSNSGRNHPLRLLYSSQTEL